MQLILSLPQSFHIITLNFILSLSISVEAYNTVMSVTNKFSKVITFVLRKITWGGKKWAVQLLMRLNLLRWDLSSAIISDHNVQFIADLWRAIFEHLCVELFYSTVYYSQTESASETTNQQAEITLWYYLMIMNNIADWLMILLCLQVTSNNIYWTSTCQTLNEVLYEFHSSEVLDLLQTNVSTEFNCSSTMKVEAHSTDEECLTECERLWEAWRRNLLSTMFSYWLSYIDVKDTIAWAVIQVKFYYDSNWQPQFFSVKDEVLLQLHCEYKLSEVTN